MISCANPAEREAIIEVMREAYMEIFPTDSIEERLGILGPNAYVAVTCSPTRGVDETIDLTERLVAGGYRVVPHLAAKMVRDRAHLRDLLQRLNELPVDSVFVPGGDSSQPIGSFANAFELLTALAEHTHKFTQIGVAAHPEGHPEVADEMLLRELERKQPLATYLVTQMCFDAKALGQWLRRIRERGIDLPAWIGIPGVADRAALLRTSLRIGVGDSMRFLRRKSDAAAHLMRHSTYTPDKLLGGMAPLLADRSMRIAGLHIFCFNLVEKTERWRLETLNKLAGEADSG